MQRLSHHITPALGQALTLRGAIFVTGKLCLIAAVFFTLWMGDNFRQARLFKLPDLGAEVLGETAVERTKQDLNSYNIIASRNIFGSRGEKGETKTAQPAATNLKLRLVGTNVSADGSFAIVENTADKNQDVFDLNSMIFDQAKLVEIQPERIKIERQGKMEVLLLQEGDGGAPSDGGISESAPEGKTEFTVSEEELNNELANLPRLLSQARAVPYFRNGKSVGMRLFAIRAGSLYEKLGLKNGDIIKAVNNNSLADPAQALKLFEQLKSERSISVKAERAGQDVDLSYNIR